MINDSKEPEGYKRFKTLNGSQNIYKQIFETAALPIIVHDLSLNIVDSNQKASEFFGYDRMELLQMNVRNLHTGEELTHSRLVEEEMKAVDSTVVETSFETKDGEIVHARVNPNKYIIDDTPFIYVFITDITEHKRLESKLQQANTALEQENLKVKHHSRELEKKNKELKDYAYFSAHDLKAPLINLKQLFNLLDLSTIQHAENKSIIEKIKESSLQLHDTVIKLNEIINLKASLDSQKTKVSFETIVEEIKTNLTEQIESAGIQIEEDFSACSSIFYPKMHLKSILQNLLVNAIKYRDDRKTAIIRLKTWKKNDKCYFSITDNGLGFDAEQSKNKVFGLFKRLHKHTEGKGVGMYIVKTILDKHSDTIQVDSIPGKGTTFIITFKNQSYE